VRLLVTVVLLLVAATAARADDAKECRGGNLPACVSLADREANLFSAYLRLTLLCHYGVAGACDRADEIKPAPPLTRMREYARDVGNACKANDDDACMLAAMSMQDFGNADALAADLYERACDHGLPLACYRLGLIYDTERDWTGRPKDDAKAFQLYRRACDQAGVGCGRLSSFYDGKHGRPRDDDESERLNVRECERQHVGWACNDIGETEEWRKHPAAAHARYVQACDYGSEYGCRNLALDLLGGRNDTAVDVPRARDLLDRICHQTDDDELRVSCDELGEAELQLGHKEAARKLFTPRCAAGKGKACVGLAMVLGGGKGNARDAKRAVAFLERACTLKAARGCYELAMLYLQGSNGLRRDLKKARVIFDLACDGDHGPGCLAAGLLWARQRKDEAERRLRKACDLDVDESCGVLEDLALGVPPRLSL
jgi:TPR repeat protein